MGSRVPFGLIEVDLIGLSAAVEEVVALAAGPAPALVMTPNLHRYSLVEVVSDVRSAYAVADLVLPDGWPIASALRRSSEQATVAQVCGSDLLPALLGAAACRGLKVALVGGHDPRRAAEGATRSHPELQVVWTDDSRYAAPPTEDEVARFVDEARVRAPDIVVLGLGAPKEEMLALRALPRLDHGVVLCLGGSIDYISGHQRRAPAWLVEARLEWAWRTASDPGRLWERYLKPLPAFLRAASKGRRRP